VPKSKKINKAFGRPVVQRNSQKHPKTTGGTQMVKSRRKITGKSLPVKRLYRIAVSPVKSMLPRIMVYAGAIKPIWRAFRADQVFRRA
jgi:hypothetical protein